MGIALILTGFLVIFMSKKIGNKKSAIPVASYFVVMGILITIGTFLNSEEIVFFTMCIGTGWAFLYAGVISIRKTLSHTEKVIGIYRDLFSFSGRSDCKTRFSYEWSKKRYDYIVSQDCNKHRYLKRTYEKGERYAIYINPESPENFVMTRRISFETRFAIIIGAVFCIFPFYLYFFNLTG